MNAVHLMICQGGLHPGTEEFLLVLRFEQALKGLYGAKPARECTAPKLEETGRAVLTIDAAPIAALFFQRSSTRPLAPRSTCQAPTISGSYSVFVKPEILLLMPL